MNVKFLFPVILFGLLAGCDDEEKIASVEGTWQGTKAEGEVLVYGVPTGFEEEDDTFNPILEFKPGGVVTLTQDGVPAKVTGRKPVKNLRLRWILILHLSTSAAIIPSKPFLKQN